MLLDLPKNKEKIIWTNHSKEKMKYYRLSDKKVLHVLRKPERKEEGIALGTIAVMQTSGTKKHPTEIWTMYQAIKRVFKGRKSKNIKIISAWRYPGRTPVGQRPVIPDDILENLEDNIK